MSIITVGQLKLIAGSTPDAANVQSMVSALVAFGATYGIDRPHRLAQFLAQVCEESGGFRFDHEIWGPTAAQKKYDTRTDLGNTPEVDGDGKRYAGRGPIQITGKANVTAFRDWCRHQGMTSVPDFVADPDKINTDPWEGLSAIWYWSSGNPTGKSLNVYADEGNIEQITKRINGGLNGLDQRIRFYARAALVLLGYAPEALITFQKAEFPHDESMWDGDPGPKTRAALHAALVALMPDHKRVPTKAAPVVEEKTVAVVPEGVQHRTGLWVWGSTALAGSGAQIAGIFADWPWWAKAALAVLALGGIVYILIRGETLVRRAKAILAEIGA